MAKDGYLVFDSDMHIMEPPDLWQRFIAPEFRSLAPRGVTSENVRDLRIAFPAETAGTARVVGANRGGHNFERNQVVYKSDSERGWTGEVQLDAMDAEGLDAAVMFPSR